MHKMDSKLDVKLVYNYTKAEKGDEITPQSGPEIEDLEVWLAHMNLAAFLNEKIIEGLKDEIFEIEEGEENFAYLCKKNGVEL